MPSSNSSSHPVTLVGDVLVMEKYTEMYDAHNVVASLHQHVQQIQTSREKQQQLAAANGDKSTANVMTFESVMPLFVDNLHLHCWVNRELNRVLIAELFLHTTFINSTQFYQQPLMSSHSQGG
jgi:hypothetical protein